MTLSNLPKFTSSDQPVSPVWDQPGLKPKPGKKQHWLLRYGMAVLLFAATIGISLLLNYFSAKINMTIPVVFALVAAAWYGGRGPGLLISVLFQATTIIYVPIPPDSNLPKAIFSYFSIFSLYVFLTLVISGLKKLLTRLGEQRDLLQVTLASIGDGVIATDTNGRVTFMNPIAQKLTGWAELEARGVQLEEVVRIINEETRREVINPVTKVLETGTLVGLANHSVLISKDGKEIPIDNTAAPITDRGEVKGVVLVFSDITTRKEAERSRRESEIMHRLVEAQEAERRRIARDLHDHLGQKMTALRLRLESVSEKSSDHPVLGPAIDELQQSASCIDRDIGFLSWELRPTELENLGLVDALGSFVREWSGQYEIAAEFHSNRIECDSIGDRLPQNVETNLYRIVQEALNNVLKHADAKNVSVLLQQRNDHITLIIEDDGRGFASGTHSGRLRKPGGLGLVGMHERAAVMNGSLEIDSAHGAGTTILARIPLEHGSGAKNGQKFGVAAGV